MAGKPPAQINVEMSLGKKALHKSCDPKETTIPTMVQEHICENHSPWNFTWEMLSNWSQPNVISCNFLQGTKQYAYRNWHIQKETLENIPSSCGGQHGRT